MIDPIVNETLSAIQQGLFLLENHGITLIFTGSFLYLIIKGINAAIDVTVNIIKKRHGIDYLCPRCEKGNSCQKKIKQMIFLFNFFKHRLIIGL